MNRGTSLDLSNVVKLAVDQDGEILIVTFNDVFVYNPESEKTRRFILNESIGVSYRTACITRKNEYVIGTNKGLRIYDKPTGRYESYIHDSFDSKSLSHNLIRAIYEDKYGHLWIGTFNKLNKFDRSSKSFESFNLKPRYVEQGRNNLILSIKTLSDGADNKILVGTETGLILFDIETNSFGFLTSNKPEQISNEVIKSIYPVSSDEIWLGTDFGLNRYSVQTGEVTSFFSHIWEQEFYQ